MDLDCKIIYKGSERQTNRFTSLSDPLSLATLNLKNIAAAARTKKPL